MTLVCFHSDPISRQTFLRGWAPTRVKTAILFAVAVQDVERPTGPTPDLESAK